MSYYGRLLEAHMVARERLNLLRVPNVKHFSDERGWVSHRVVAKIDGDEVGHITISHVPRLVYDERLADREQFCRVIEGRHDPSREEMRRAARHHHRFERFHVDSVHVAYVSVEAAHRRRGIARSLYLEAARWVGEQGLVLAASDLQQPEAEALWASLVADPSVPTTTTSDGRPALDFT